MSSERSSKGRDKLRVSHPIGVHFRTSEDGRWLVGRLAEFGWDGARLLCEQKLAQGQRIELRFIMPNQHGNVILPVQVMWIKGPSRGEKLNAYGVAFSEGTGVRETVMEAVRYVLRADKGGAVRKIERRRSRRVTRSCTAGYRLGGADEWLGVDIVNLSAHGVRFVSHSPLPENTLLELHITANGTDLIRVTGRVVWSKPGEAIGSMQGVDFVKVSSGYDKAFETFVQWVSARHG